MFHNSNFQNNNALIHPFQGGKIAPIKGNISNKTYRGKSIEKTEIFRASSTHKE